MHWLVGIARERVADRVAGLGLADGRVHGLSSAVVTERRIRPRVARVAVIGVDDVAGCAARLAVVPGLIVRAHEPGERIIQARLGDIQHRDRDARTGARAAIRLAKIRTPRLFNPLQLAVGIGKPGLGKEVADVAAAALEHAEHVRGLDRLPRRQRIQLRQDVRSLRGILQIVGDHRALQYRCCAVVVVGLAEDVVLVGQHAIVVGRAAPEHRGG